jgi:transposase
MCGLARGPAHSHALARVLEPQAREVMAELTVAVGRPMVHDLRVMCDAVAYVVRNGIEWRALAGRSPALGGGVCVL